MENELTRLLDNIVPSPRDRQLVRRILGWDGQGACSIKHAGEEFGITRERARQILASAIESVRAFNPSTSLPRVLRFVHSMRNQAATGVAEELERRGWIAHTFGLRALVHTARLFGCEPEFDLEEACGELFVVAGGDVVKSILRAALRSSSHYGLQTVSDICAAISPQYRTSRDHLLIRQVLNTRPDLRWLDAGQEWFWLEDAARNPIVRCIKKLLCFASPIPLADVYRAVRKCPRRKANLTIEAVAGLCRQAAFCKVRGQTVERAFSASSAGLISPDEATVCKILRRHGNELPIERLQELSDAASIKRPNLWRILSQSPLLFRSEPGTYRVVTAAR